MEQLSYTQFINFMQTLSKQEQEEFSVVCSNCILVLKLNGNILPEVVQELKEKYPYLSQYLPKIDM